MVIEGEMPGSAPPMMPQTTPPIAANAAGVVVSAVQACANMSIAGVLDRSSRGAAGRGYPASARHTPGQIPGGSGIPSRRTNIRS